MMDNEEAKLILAAGRPRGQDAEDPAMAEALSLAGRDPALQQWLERERAFDLVVCRCLEEVRPPDDLRRHILAGHRAAHPGARRQPVWVPLAMAASIALTFAIGFFAGSQGQGRGGGAEGFALADYRQSMVRMISGEFELDKQSDRIEELASFVSQRSAPVPGSFHGPLSGEQAIGCKVIDWQGRKVTLLCFRNQTGHVLHLFVTEIREIQEAGATERILARVGDLPTVSWRDQNRQYLLAGHTPDTDLSAYY